MKPDLLKTMLSIIALLVLSIFAVGSAENSSAPASVAPPSSGGLVSSAGRIFIGTRLYQGGKPVGTVLAVSDKDPNTGANRDMVFVKFDSSSEPEWKTRDVIKTYFQVKE
jgi:hypothetical protein